MKTARFQPVGDCGILLRFGDSIDLKTHKRVMSADQAIRAAGLAGVTELTPSYAALLVGYDPLKTDYQSLMRDISLLKPESTTNTTAKKWTVPVCYDAEFAPDLPAVAEQTGMSDDAVINAHLESLYHIYMYGFAPGYAYLGGVKGQIQLPRKSEPVRDIPAGAVMIAGPQCIVTTITMPTGWWIIGRSDYPIFRPDDDNPFPMSVGDEIRFERVKYDDFMRQRTP